MDVSNFQTNFGNVHPNTVKRGGHFSEANAEYNFIDHDKLKDQFSQERLFDINDILQQVDFRILEIVFIVLDVIILFYRLSHIAINAHKLCQGFTQTKIVDGEKSKEIQLRLYENAIELDAFTNLNDEKAYNQKQQQLAYDLPDYTSSLDSRKSILKNSGVSNCASSAAANARNSFHNDNGTKQKLSLFSFLNYNIYIFF